MFTYLKKITMGKQISHFFLFFPVFSISKQLFGMFVACKTNFHINLKFNNP